MLACGANVVMLLFGANVIIWCYHVMLSSGMITPPYFIFPENFTHSQISSHSAGTHLCRLDLIPLGQISSLWGKLHLARGQISSLLARSYPQLGQISFHSARSPSYLAKSHPPSHFFTVCGICSPISASTAIMPTCMPLSLTKSFFSPGGRQSLCLIQLTRGVSGWRQFQRQHNNFVFCSYSYQ